MRPDRGLLGLAISLLLGLTACGDATGPEPETSRGEWESQQLEAKVGSDNSPLLATSGEDALVISVSEKGTLLSHLSVAGAPFEPGEPLQTGTRFVRFGDVVPLPDGGWFALGSGGSFQRDGDTEIAFDPLAFRSSDGLTWEQVEVTGFEQPLDVNDVAVIDGLVVVAGNIRPKVDEGMGGYAASLWTSPDARAFTKVDLPGVPTPRGYRDDSYAGQLAQVGDRVLVAGRVSRSAALWASDDRGRSWVELSAVGLDDLYDLTALTTVDDVLVAGAAGAKVSAVRSTDQGVTWTAVKALPVESEEAGWAPVWADQARFWTLTGVDDMSWSNPEVCYADLDQCGKDPGPRLATSMDGLDWTAVDLPGEPDEITGTADGRVLVLAVNRQGLVVHTLAAGSTPPEAPTESLPKTVDLVTVEEGETPEVGVRYHAPMYVHCGMDWFWFGDATWRRTDDGPDVETGAGDGSPEGWPMSGQVIYGFATLTDADHLVYSTGDEAIATYERAEGAPGCA
jgi:hypothetical protein